MTAGRRRAGVIGLDIPAGVAAVSAPACERFGVTVHAGDCLDVLTEMPNASVHAVVTDPPYGLEFMGKEWDSFRPASARLRTRVDQRTNPAEGNSDTVTPPEAYVAGHPFQAWCAAWMAECLRVLKPGGHLLAFGGSRTWHRLTCAAEDAGFEIRDSMAWLYAQGFPKSHNLKGDWQGWGTALKPGFEPIVVARKPLAGTVAGNVLAHGVGALNIDGCRVPDGEDVDLSARQRQQQGEDNGWRRAKNMVGTDVPLYKPGGRWPSNVVLTHAATPDGVDLCGDGCVPGCPVRDLDEQTVGKRAAKGSVGSTRGGGGEVYGGGAGFAGTLAEVGQRLAGFEEGGSASRFFPVFRFEAKAPAAERPRVDGVAHPTVKPLALMRWLVRLVTPPGGVVLDPFLGSGTTAQAARAEGFRCVGIERDETYLPLIRARLDGVGDGDLFAGAS